MKPHKEYELQHTSFSQKAVFTCPVTMWTMALWHTEEWSPCHWECNSHVVLAR